MPIDYKNYPNNWKEISAMIRLDRAAERCECTGLCGIDHKAEAESQPEVLALVAELKPKLHVSHRCMAINGASHPITGSTVVLTVAHVCKDVCEVMKREGRLCGITLHLRAMCQRCHLKYDAPEHRANAAATRRAQKNNMELFD